MVHSGPFAARNSGERRTTGDAVVARPPTPGELAGKAPPGLRQGGRFVLSSWPIRNKLLLCLVLLLVIVATLCWSGFHGLYDYRGLLKSLFRVTELPLATELNQAVSDLRVAALRKPRQQIDIIHGSHTLSWQLARAEFLQRLDAVEDTVAEYEQQLDANRKQEFFLGDDHQERQTLAEIKRLLTAASHSAVEWQDKEQSARLDEQLVALQRQVSELPRYLQERMNQFPAQVRSRYDRRLWLVWVTSAACLAVLAAFCWLTYRSILRPLRLLIKGARKVAAGQFHYRIRLDTADEMAELAGAMNVMTSRFQSIRDDLDRQVADRTRQVVRTEQLASVGYLAAGVAHDISTPLETIVRAAEALDAAMDDASASPHVRREVLLKHLMEIQEQAFCCKGITENLLDFSRASDTQRKPAELREIVQSVVDLASHLGKNQGKQVVFTLGPTLYAAVNVQQIKQVAVNLVVNALERIEAGGTVTVSLRQAGHEIELVVEDDGPRLSEEELHQVFEPNCGSRRCGAGIGLGLSISAKIIEDHGGRITAHSSGPGVGTRLRVCLPTTPATKENEHRYQAA